MNDRSIYEDIRLRTNGDIYIGVVGPVRTGKSTLIKRFMDTLVLPHMADEHKKERASDELPQSAAGRTIMTTEPKFIPEQAAEIRLDGGGVFRVRLIDCVGYIVPSSLGYIEGEQPRMVKTPWFDEEIPFNMAAELGTEKVITEHSTIGLVVTTDGSISDIPREEYEEAEERVISELKELGKPFTVLLNCMFPTAASAKELANRLTEKYGVPVLAVNCLELTEEQIKHLLREQVAEVASLLEVLISVLVLIGLVISAVPVAREMLSLWSGGSTEAFQTFLGHAFNLVIGIEFIKMLAKHSPGSALEVLLYAIARNMILGHGTTAENLLGVAAIGLIFIIRKFLFVPSFGATMPDGEIAYDIRRALRRLRRDEADDEAADAPGA